LKQLGQQAETSEQRTQKKDSSGMDRSAKVLNHPAASRSLREAIRRARLEEAERLDEAADHRDGEFARLELLKSELEAVFADIPKNDDRFSLVLVPSRPARLWIDLFTYVSVDEGTNVYLFMRNSEDGRRTLFRTINVAEMADRIADYVARQIVQRERIEEAIGRTSVPYQDAPSDPKPKFNARVVVMSFIIGMLTGAVALFAAVWLTAS
jgi:hypothetical protein